MKIGLAVGGHILYSKNRKHIGHMELYVEPCTLRNEVDFTSVEGKLVSNQVVDRSLVAA